MGNMKVLKLLTLTCVLILIMLILTSIVIYQPLDGTPFGDNNEINSITVLGMESNLGESIRGDAKDGENTEQHLLTTFATNGSRFTLLGTPAGKNAYISIPFNANVSNATMKLRGKMPDPINRYGFGGRHSFISGADFNNDGSIDLMTTDKDAHSFYVLLNNGQSNFNTVTEYPAGDLPLRGTINDFNNDGFMDIAVVNQGGNSLTVYRNSADDDAIFKNRKDYKIGDWPRDLTSSDLNNDGWIDIASVSSTDHKLWLNLNTGNSTVLFSSAINYSTEQSPVGIASGDLNNDEIDDLAIINVGANITVNGARYYYSVSVLINKGNAEFEPRVNYIIGKNPAKVLIDDLNNDGLLDIATSNRAGYNISVLLNKGSGKFQNAVNYSLIDRPYSGRTLRTGDVDGDGFKDIVSISSKLNTLEVLINNGNGTFQDYIDYQIPLRPVDLFLADFDVDGDLDAAICSQDDSSVAIVPNNGDGIFSDVKFYYTGTRPQGITNGDFDNDGDIDLVTANYLSGTITVKYNDGIGNFDEELEKNVAVEPFAITTGDLDNDNYLDVFTADEALFKVVIIKNGGEGKFDEPIITHDVSGYPYSIMFHDLDGDGYNEIITCNNAQLSISILKNLGNESFAPFQDYSFEAQHPFFLAAGDMDNDDDEDIICTIYDANMKVVEHNITIIWNNGNGTFSSHTNYDIGTTPKSVRVSDVDLDGDLDIISSNIDSDTATVLMNLNNATFGNQTDYQVGDAPSNLELSDIDMDGYPDIITANQNNDSVSILYNKGSGEFTDHIEYLIGGGPIFITSADLNNDGFNDVATSNLVTHSMSVRLDLHPPGNISVDLFADGLIDVYHPGVLNGNLEIPDFTDQLRTYLASHKSEAISTPYGKMIKVPINIVARMIGNLELVDLEIGYHIPKDFDLDGIPDNIDIDDDNDGLPDDWESSNGLSLKNAKDAKLDNDRDNLNNLEEYSNNTDPRNEDTDFDKIHDGVEIKEYGTNPLEADTDGDDFDDYEEITEGYDPLDSEDHPPKADGGVCFTPGFEIELFLIAVSILIITIYFKFDNRHRLN